MLELKDGVWEPEFRRVPYDVDRAVERYESSGMLASGGLSAHIFREEVVFARSFLVPFLMWCETDGREKTEEAWNEFRQRFDARFRTPESSREVRSSTEP